MPRKPRRRGSVARAAAAKAPTVAAYVLPQSLVKLGWKMVHDRAAGCMRAKSPEGALFATGSDKFKRRVSSAAPEVGEVPPWMSPTANMLLKRKVDAPDASGFSAKRTLDKLARETQAARFDLQWKRRVRVLLQELREYSAFDLLEKSKCVLDAETRVASEQGFVDECEY